MDPRQLEQKQLAQSSCLEENRVNHEGRETKVVSSNARPAGSLSMLDVCTSQSSLLLRGATSRQLWVCTYDITYCLFSLKLQISSMKKI